MAIDLIFRVLLIFVQGYPINLSELKNTAARDPKCYIILKITYIIHTLNAMK